MTNHNNLSAINRKEQLLQMSQTKLDVLIIGGGITGAGIAWDASQRGMLTGLIEMRDFAWGTSSRSTKLVHGGLRYLKQGEIKLVMEVGRERALLHRNAPHIVIPAPMLLPIYKGGTMGYVAASIGLYIYDWLAGVKRKERRLMLGSEKTMELEPLCKSENLKGGGLYYEYRTDDARLTIDVLKTAVRHGAMIVNYAKAEQFIYTPDHRKIIGVQVRDEQTGQIHKIMADKIINAAGPWVDLVRGQDRQVTGKKLLLTKGVHLVVKHSKFPLRQAVYFDVAEGRMIFAIPRGKHTYFGTTDTVYQGRVETPRVTKQDRDYLLEAIQAAFPAIRLTASDIESSWVGLRPLILEEGKAPSEVSRKDEIFISESGLITIAGGKLTGFRKMAQKVVDLTAQMLWDENGVKYAACQTAEEIISGGNYGGFNHFADHLLELNQEGQRLGLPDEIIKDLLNIYGSNIKHIYNNYSVLTSNPMANDTPQSIPLPNSNTVPDKDPHNSSALPDKDPHNGSTASNESSHNRSALPNKDPHNSSAVLDEPSHNSSALPDKDPHNSSDASNESSHNRSALLDEAPHNSDVLFSSNQLSNHHNTVKEEQARTTSLSRLLRAELIYVIHHEMATGLTDYFIRRTGKLYFDRPAVLEQQKEVSAIMSELLQWNEDEVKQQNAELEQELAAVIDFIG